MDEDEFLKRSKENLKKILEKEDLLDENLEKAFDKVPREFFFPLESRSNAYLNNAFEIGFGQTISQPTMIFLMLKKLDLKKHHKVLEIGTGSGYLTALLCELSSFVYSIERIKELAQQADKRLKELGYTNYKIFVADGTKGLKEFSPYDRIIVSASGPKIPKTLVEQLNQNGGILVMPIGGLELQRLTIIRKVGSEIEIKDDIMCRFVPLIGEEGFDEKIYNDN
ncbi:MAG: protein-L-isoaspartate(D-aspartate) O-methyltransferase [Brevinematia bacterium]